jgi:predicted DCC family thiol-disulfide oxidoreductase YuxK/GNAT superfamily N-acetyltransferase
VRYAPGVSPGALHIRLARASELPDLQRIEREAGERFRGLGLLDHLLDHSLSLRELSEHQRAGRVWVAVDDVQGPVGFAVASVVDGHAHLEELDVVPGAGRRGIGSRLVDTVCEWASGQGFSAITLSTFREVPWNAPFYARRGFRQVPVAELSPGLRGVRAREARLGIAMDRRVVMRRSLTPGEPRSPLHLVLYDGECGICSRTVRWLLAADRRGLLHFAPLQGTTAAALRRRWPDLPDDLDSLIYVDRSDGGEQVSWRSTAALRIGRLLGGPWGMLATVLDWLPRSVADATYDAFARRRHLLGSPRECAVPSPLQRVRFLP